MSSCNGATVLKTHQFPASSAQAPAVSHPSLRGLLRACSERIPRYVGAAGKGAGPLANMSCLPPYRVKVNCCKHCLVCLVSIEESCLRWAAGLASGSWLTTVLQTLHLLHSAKFASDLNMTGWLPVKPQLDEPWVQEEVQIWETAWKLLVEIAAARTYATQSGDPCFLWFPKQTNAKAASLNAPLEELVTGNLQPLCSSCLSWSICQECSGPRILYGAPKKAVGETSRCRPVCQKQ